VCRAYALVYYPFTGSLVNALGTGFDGVGSSATDVGPTPDRYGVVDAATQVANGGTITFGDLPLATGSYSIGYWIRNDATPDTISYRHLSKREACVAGDFFDYALTPDGPVQGVGHETRSTGTGTGSIGASVSGMPRNGWLHVLHVVDTAASQSRVYINGLEEEVVDFPAGTTMSIDNDADFGVGISPCLGQVGLFPFTGALDDVVVFERVVTASEAWTLAQY
jgi:hypothetical protein